MKRLTLPLIALAFAACEKGKSQMDSEQSFVVNKDGIDHTLINGQEVDLQKWPFVVRILTGNAGCSATVIGPKVVVTAAHCAATGATSKFSINGKQYTATAVRSDLYPAKDHDVSVLILSSDIPKSEVKRYASVGGSPAVGQKGYLMGYGCVSPGGGGGNDGKLRAGFAPITGFSGYDIVSGGSGSSALCFGDSGGPMFTSDDPDKAMIQGINSKGNIRDTNYNLNLTSAESLQFLKGVASSKAVEICGVNGTKANCEGDGPDPTPPPPPPGDCDMAFKKQILMGAAKCFEVPIVLPVQ